MQTLCQRCGEAASSRDQAGDVTSFCPHCGAPQLVFEAEDAPAVEGFAAPPPPRPRAVEWRAAIGSAALVAGVGVLLFAAAARIPLLSLITCLWITSGSLIALGLYHRRVPLARLDASAGARIGSVTGLAMAACFAAAVAGAAVLARYPLHVMNGFDAQMAAVMRDSMQRATASGANASTPELLRVFSSQEFKAGILLSGLGMVSLGVVAYSTLAGALGGMMYARRPTGL